MGFSGQEYWSGLPFPSPGDLPKPGIEPQSPALQADALSSEPPGKPYSLAKETFGGGSFSEKKQRLLGLIKNKSWLNDIQLHWADILSHKTQCS